MPSHLDSLVLCMPSTPLKLSSTQSVTIGWGQKTHVSIFTIDPKLEIKS